MDDKFRRAYPPTPDSFDRRMRQTLAALPRRGGRWCARSIAAVALAATLALGGIMNAGFDQIFIMYNASVYETADILDTFIYRQGLVDSQYSLSTALGLFKSLIGATLLIVTNLFATKKFNYRIF